MTVALLHMSSLFQGICEGAAPFWDVTNLGQRSEKWLNHHTIMLRVNFAHILLAEARHVAESNVNFTHRRHCKLPGSGWEWRSLLQGWGSE